MTHETWTTLGTIVALLAIGGYNAWQSRRAARTGRAAAENAATAASRSEATSNGFAGDVLGRLRRIEETVAETKSLAQQTHKLMVDHLSAHARSDLQDS